MASKLAEDPRIDPRLKAMFGAMEMMATADVASREELLALEHSEAGNARAAQLKAMLDALDNEFVAPSAGLVTTEHKVVSAPDGNTINIRFIRPEGSEALPCVYYIHGGGMQTMSCVRRQLSGLGKDHRRQRRRRRHGRFPQRGPRLVGPRGRAVPGRAQRLRLGPEVGGRATPPTLGVDPSRIIVAGESGGGNLTLATGLKLKKDGDIGLIKGLYALCPYIAGRWPLPENPSSTENNGILLDLHNNRGAMGYGIEALEAGNPLAWPGFATAEDVKGLPPVVISVNECDPLRDEGVNFYRLLLMSGVPARCRQVMGTIHGTEIFPVCCPEISRDTARDIAAFCKG